MSATICSVSSSIMKRLAGLILGGCFLVAGIPDTLAAEAWILEKEDSGIRVYTRPVEGSPIREFRGEIILNATLDSALALLDDIPACVNWLHQCKEGRLLNEESFGRRYIYQANNMPFPVRDRDYIFFVTLAMHEDKQGVTLALDSRPEFIPETDDVRIENARGTYDLIRTVNNNGDEQILMVWEQHIEPAGTIPRWLVNLLLVDIPFNSLRNFRGLVQDEKYRNALLSYDSNGNITGFQ